MAKRKKTEEAEEPKALLADIPEGVAGKAADMVRAKSEDFKRVYSNNVALSFSMWDMSIAFGEIVGEEDGKPVVEEHVKVTMSLQHAKAFAAILGANIVRFERETGQINIPSFSDKEEQ